VRESASTTARMANTRMRFNGTLLRRTSQTIRPGDLTTEL
jgi:hypothetical protein